MTWFRVGGAGIPASLKNNMNSVLNKKFGTTGQNYPPNGWPADVNLLGPLPEMTVAGAIAHTDDAADTVPVKSVICSIVPKQAGSGTPSPTNPRAISGYTGLTITKTGKNLFNNTGLFPTSGSVSSYYFKQFDVSSGLIPEIHLKAGVTYTFAVDVISTIEPFNFSVGCGNGSYSTDILTVYNKNNGRVSITFTPTTAQLSNGDVFAFRCPRYGAQNTYDYTISNVQLEIGSTATTYSAFASETTSDSWSSIGAIYGGERDLTEGTLKETFEIFTFDGSQDENWGIFTVNTNQTLFRIYDTPRKSGTLSGSSGIPSFCNMFEKAPNESSGRTDGKYSGTGTNIDFIYNSAVDLAEWRSFLSNNPIQIIIEKDSATTYSSLQTYDFETLYAVNNFYSDIEGGQTQLTYRQDIDLALQAVSSSRGLMMTSRPVTQLIGEESDPDQVNELVEDDEIEQEGEDNAR